MTRKDYEMIAEAIKDAAAYYTVDQVNMSRSVSDCIGAGKGIELAATYIADGLAQDNPSFDRKRFMVACGFSA
jgi:hypothetical protein